MLELGLINDTIYLQILNNLWFIDNLYITHHIYSIPKKNNPLKESCL